MKDRLVQYPHRYKIIKPNGTEEIVEIRPEHGEITEAGTPLNKATFFSDSTARILQLGGSNALPDRALAKLAGVVKLTHNNKVALGVTDDYGLQRAITILAQTHEHKVGVFREMREWNKPVRFGANDFLTFAKRYGESGEESTEWTTRTKLFAPLVRPAQSAAKALVRVRLDFGTVAGMGSSPKVPRFQLLKNRQAISVKAAEVLMGFGGSQATFALDMQVIAAVDASAGDGDYFEIKAISASDNLSGGTIREFSLTMLE